ncbi:MAG: Lrp/AsnC family transcriptional regulator, partial [Fervidicoccaceae archaeon]
MKSNKRNSDKITFTYGFGYDTIEVIETIKKEQPPIKIRNIAKKLGVTEDYVRRRIKKLEKSGIGFRANFDLRKIGLSTLAVIFKEPLSFDPVTRIKGFDKNLPYILRWHGNVTFPNPMGIALFYVPYNIEVKDSVMKLLKRCQLPEVIEAYELNVTQYDDLDLRRELLLNDIKSRWKNLTNKILEESNTYEKPSN